MFNIRTPLLVTVEDIDIALKREESYIKNLTVRRDRVNYAISNLPGHATASTAGFDAQLDAANRRIKILKERRKLLTRSG